MFCQRCGFGQPDDHRFCVACGAQLAVHLARAHVPKVTRLFLGIQTSQLDPADAVLRVSRYIEDHEFSAPEGTVVVPGEHARFSVWVVDRPVAAIITGSGAEDLGRFLLDPEPNAMAVRRRGERHHGVNRRREVRDPRRPTGRPQVRLSAETAGR